MSNWVIWVWAEFSGLLLLSIQVHVVSFSEETNRCILFSSKSAKAQSIVGTPFYMSPEVIENQAYSYASDVWSLGCIVYEMVMGESPFYIQGNASLFLVAQKILNCSYTPIPDMYSEQLRQLVHSMIQRDSAARPTVHQIEEILRTYLSQGLANYEDLGVIGRGTHSEVHKCRCRRTNQMVAVKKVHIFEMDSSARRECVNEAKLLQTVPDHPNIIKYIESFLSGNELYLVLELAECGDLAQVVQTMRTNGQRFGELQIWRYLVQIAGALAHMHESRVMHRGTIHGNSLFFLHVLLSVSYF
jgi:serine/threonine protein kinase